ncbi:MAG: hypothetical protein ABWY93_04845 [Mycobacterium sp.]
MTEQDTPADAAADEQWNREMPQYRELLKAELKLLMTANGWPSREAIAERAGIPLWGVRNVLNAGAGTGYAAPWNPTRAVVETLGGDLRYFYPLWLRGSSLRGSRQQLADFERIAAEGLPTLADPENPFELPGHDAATSNPAIADTDSVLTFVDALPPLGERLYLPHHEWAQQLRQRPGQWACVTGIHNPGYASQVNYGQIVHYRPAGAFEACWRQHRLYMRYVGAQSEPL